MRNDLAELGIKSSISDDKLRRITKRRIEHYEQEIEKLTGDLERVLSIQEVADIEEKLIEKCLGMFDDEVLRHWGRKIDDCWRNPPSSGKSTLFGKKNKKYTYLEEAKGKFFKMMTDRRGRLALAANEFFSKQCRAEFETFCIQINSLRETIASVMPLLPKDLDSLHRFSIEAVQRQENYCKVNEQTGGLLTEKLGGLFEGLKSRNEEMLSTLRQALLAVFTRHTAIVSEKTLPQLESVDNYYLRVKQELWESVSLYRFDPPQDTECSVRSEDSQILPPLMSHHIKCIVLREKNKESFDDFDAYLGGELARELINFRDFLSHTFEAVNQKRTLTNPFPLQENLKTHVFLSHDWGEGKKNHFKVRRIGEALREKGLLVWIDDYSGDRGESGVGTDLTRIFHGINETHCVLVFVTANYVKKVNSREEDEPSNWCRREFLYASDTLRGSQIIPVVMESQVRDTKTWGLIKFNLPQKLYVDFSEGFSEGGDEAFETSLNMLFEKVMDVLRSFPRPTSPSQVEIGGVDEVPQKQV